MAQWIGTARDEAGTPGAVSDIYVNL